MLVNAIGYLAEAAYHHPDLSVTWAKVCGEAPDPQRRRASPTRTSRCAQAIEECSLWRPPAAPSRARRTSSCGGGDPGRTRLSIVNGAARPTPPACCSSPAGSPSRRSGACSIEMAPPFAYDVAVLGITVAALMTTAVDRALPAIAADRHRPRADPRSVRGRPGGHRPDGSACASRRGRRTCARSPSTSATPRSRATTAPTTSRSSPRSTTRPGCRATRCAAERIACASPAPTSSTSAARPASRSPPSATSCASSWPPACASASTRFDPGEIRTAVDAGAELVLSVNGTNLDAARSLAGRRVRVVVIPDLGAPLDTLEPTLEALDAWGVPYRHRSGHRADRLRLHGLARALRRSAPPLSRRRDADGHRQPHRAHRGRHDRRQRAAHRHVPGIGRDARCSPPR